MKIADFGQADWNSTDASSAAGACERSSRLKPKRGKNRSAVSVRR
jgi:hypothetical protein